MEAFQKRREERAMEHTLIVGQGQIFVKIPIENMVTGCGDELLKEATQFCNH